MKGIYFIMRIMLVLLVGGMMSCEDLEDTYSDYRGDGPEQYLTKIYDLQGTPQWLSVALSWNLKNDPGRTGILVKWSNTESSDSVVIDKESTGYVVENLGNYEYTFSVSAIEETDGKIVKRSLGDPVYVRPYTYDSDELLLFTRVVNKQFKVADKYLFLVFEEWTDNLMSFKIGYYEKGDDAERFWTADADDRIDNWPMGKPYALIGENIDFSKPVKVYRTGKMATVGDMVLDFNPIELFFDVPSFESDFAAEVRSRWDLQGEIKLEDVADVEVLDIDYDQVSLVDVLYFPNLKELYLGRNRFLTAGTEDLVKSSLAKEELSVGALQTVAEKLGVKIHHYGQHYFEQVPDFFTDKNLRAELPQLNCLDTDGWSISVTPSDALGFSSGIENLLVADDSYWLPQPQVQMRTHVIEIDMKGEKNVAGFEFIQAKDFGDANIARPALVDIEVENGTGQWITATYSKNTVLGTGAGETTVVYLDKNKGTKTTGKVRITISDDFYKKGYDASYNYVDFYNIVLSTIRVIGK